MLIPLCSLISFTVEMYLYCFFCNIITTMVNFSCDWISNNPKIIFLFYVFGSPCKIVYLSQYDTISTSIFSCNFTAFDAKTSKAMLLMMHMTGTRPLYLQTSGIIRFKLSLEGFLKVFFIRYRIVLFILIYSNRICLDSQDNVLCDNVDSVSLNEILVDLIMNYIHHIISADILLSLMRFEV